MPPPTLAPPRPLDLDETLEALDVWHNTDVDELAYEPDHLQLLALLSRPEDDTEAHSA
jgi:hypothetical protein